MLLAILPAQLAGADTTTTFSDGKTAETLTYNAAGKATVNVSVPDDAIVKKAGFDVDSQELALGQGYPMEVSVDVGADGSTEWSFKGTGVGALGHQSLLNDGSATGSIKFSSSSGGSDTSLRLLLPKFAKIKDGSLWVDGNGSAYQPVQTQVLKGAAINAELGWSGANVGDLNKDGWDDLAVSAMGMAKVYLFYGGPGFDGQPDMTFTGPINRYFGNQIVGLGDVNGDNIDDMAISENGSLAVRVYFGGPGLDAIPDLNLTGQPALFTYYGYCVAGGSDLNGDGFNDIAVGDYFYDTANEGRVYVYKGGPAIDNVSDYILTIGMFYPLAHSLAMGGDLTGDGWDDLAVGDPDLGGFSMGGKVYIYKGGPGFGGPPITKAVSLIRDDLFAWDMDISHDINGDGIDDLIVGAPDNGTGRVYIYWGRANWPGTAGPSVTIFGEASGDFFGYSVSGLGDLNGDGLSELLVGAPGYGAGKFYGKVYFINGSTNPQRPGATTIVGNLINAYAGWWVEDLGNIANDGGHDIAVSEAGNDSNRGDVKIFRPTWGLGAPKLSLGTAVASGLDVPLLNGTRQATFTATDLQAALDQSMVCSTDGFGNQFCLMTFTASSTGAGNMRLRGISINYTARTAGVMPLRDAFNAYLAKSKANGATGLKVPVPISVSAISKGRLMLSGLSVDYSPNKAPVAFIDGLSPTNIEAGEQVILSGHGTDDSKVVAFNWSSDLQGLLGKTPNLEVALTVVGTHNITFRVQDDLGRWSLPASATVTVTKQDHPPMVFIGTPLEGQRVTGLVAVTGRYTDQDTGDSVPVDVSIDNGGWGAASVVLTNGNSGTYTYIWDAANETDGAHAITARAYDGHLYSALALVNVTVFHPVPGIQVIPPSSMQAYPGDRIEVDFTVKNTGTGPGLFRLGTNTDPYELVEMTTPTLELGPGNSSVVKVFVHVDKATKPPADIDVGLRARLSDDPAIAAEATVTVHVIVKPPNPSEQAVGIEAPQDGSGKAGTEITYVFKLTNKGTAQDSYDIKAVSKDGWTASITVGGGAVTGPVKLDSGGKIDVTVTVQIPPKAKGKSLSELTLTVKSTNFPLVNASATVRTKVLAQPVKTSVISVPYVQIGIVIVVSTVCAMGAIIGGTEWGTFGFFWLLIPLYSRLKKEAVLDNFKRGEINAFIRLNPGTYYNEIKKHLDVSNGVLTYHLNRLQFEGYIKSKVNGRYKHYFPADMRIPARIITLNDMQRALLKFIRDKKWVTQAQISEQLDIPVPTVSRHLNRLIVAEMVTVEKRGNLNYYAIRGDWAGAQQSEDSSVSTYDVGGSPEQVYRQGDQQGYYNVDDHGPDGYRASDYQQPPDQPPEYRQ
jgi:predicted transcriptional regulator